MSPESRTTDGQKEVSREVDIINKTFEDRAESRDGTATLKLKRTISLPDDLE